MVYCAFKSKSSVDYWKIKQELQVIGLTSFVGALQFLFVVYLAVPRSHVSWKPFLQVLGHFLWLFGIFVPVALFRPLLQAEYSKFRSGGASSSIASAIGHNSFTLHPAFSPKVGEHLPKFTIMLKSSVLATLLEEPGFQTLFLEHLKQEFSSENLFFFLQVRKLYNCSLMVITAAENDAGALSLEKCNDLLKEVELIRETFIDESAPSWVNLSFLREKIYVDLGLLRTRYSEFDKTDEDEKMKVDFCNSVGTLYIDAVKEVIRLMEHDSFRRFKLTQVFKQFNDRKIAVLMVEGKESYNIIPVSTSSA
jgi:hypothetical protein